LILSQGSVPHNQDGDLLLLPDKLCELLLLTITNNILRYQTSIPTAPA
jgi:hypothetical protein